MIETSGVIEKEQGNGFYLVTLEQPAGHQCLCRAAGKLTKFRIKLLAGDKVSNLKDGIKAAAEVLDGGEALLRMEGLIELSQELGFQE